MDEHIIKTGTTTIGLVCTDGVVLAADKRVTVGHHNVGAVKKVLKVGDRFALTIAGNASDALMLSRYLRAELKLKELRSSNKVTTREAANLLAQFVFSNVRTPSMIPGITHFLFAGSDKNGTGLFDVFPDGTITEVERYFCSGSGSVYALGVIDAEYKEGLDVKEGVELVKKALRSAVMRDIASGNGYDIALIQPGVVVEQEAVVFDSPIPRK